MTDYLLNFIDLFTESAPWLLLGLLIAGFMKWLVPMELLQKHMGDNRLSSILKATFIGAPLPLCSCGVIPAAIGLRRAGASKSATVSFLVSTPETGVDSISVSYALLGPFFAIIRPISAIFTAIYAGLMVKFFALNENKAKANEVHGEIDSKESCCSIKEKELEIAKSCCDKPVKTEKTEKTSCCAGNVKEEAKPALFQLFKQSLEFSSGKLLSDITKWLLIGLLMAAAIKTWVSTDFLTQWGDGLMAMVIMALIGIPMYICATASTPLAAGFLAAGLSPGAILVFMLAGPATNIATMGMIKQEMGTSVLVAYLFSLFTASIGFGYLTNWLIEFYQITIPTIAGNEHVMNTSIIYILSALLLLALMIRNLIQKN
ncbi:MAG: hypothetical protein COA86_18275 [Kangiella sp.]|nr:MAG: hypothetical protein COA86_18275 [Kangiella sp.]